MMALTCLSCRSAALRYFEGKAAKIFMVALLLNGLSDALVGWIATTDGLDLVESLIDGVAKAPFIGIGVMDGAAECVDGFPGEIELCDAAHGSLHDLAGALGYPKSVPVHHGVKSQMTRRIGIIAMRASRTTAA